jgi:tetratricopeptide (TPR) repeat protein
MTELQMINSTRPLKSFVSEEEKDLCIFLYTIFQYYLEKANELMNQEDPLKREKCLKILNSLLENSFINHFKTNKMIYSCLNGILNFYIGLAKFSEEDQSICEGPFLKALDYFNTLPTMVKIRYINIYQEIYNNLGIVFYNKGEIKKGLQYLGKAEQMYKVFSDLKGYLMTNNFSRFMQSCSKAELSNSNNHSFCSNNPPDDKLEFFNFYIDGGLNKKSFEQNYTLTIFYYAQAFTKLGFRKKAIKYCSLTLKRQVELNEYDLKDTIINCMNLTEFYTENQHFAQAEYILVSAISLLPEDPLKKKKLRAALQNQLGKYFLERMKFAVRQTREQLWISENEELFSIVNRRIFTFANLNIIWPKIEDVRDIEEAKTLFRLSNTYLKKALEYYKLDGFVTEHINIVKDVSQLYKNLIFFETDNHRIYGMLDRRINLLHPIYLSINPKVYCLQWQVIINLYFIGIRT